MIDPVLTTQTIALYPNRAQSARMEHFLFVGRVAFNRALSAHRFWYAKSGKGLNYYDHYAATGTIAPIATSATSSPSRIISPRPIGSGTMVGSCSTPSPSPRG